VACTERKGKDAHVVISEYQNIIMWNKNDDDRDVGLFIKDSINFKVREDLCVLLPHAYESLFTKTESECNL